ncbi:ribosome biogenesis GTPase YlqF [Lactococcus kimchii]|uniref:ribosome biogenesis GTPase YlqF n=1 Tax=Lactococcus sp. S-13 TaxID=2507158 RepID=UPI001022C7AF|nr:ribosome biogenesis GTPase YlqF [Lactococcus sp. S-13]RZI48134.1 ribosome biogenesis GTPase YlqF [Lactococcus sp. S-13]
MSNIQWFPGHMSKARRQVQENLKYVDFVIELVDARLPMASRNPMLSQIIGDKPRIIALNKVDLADPVAVASWIEYFDAQGFVTLAINSKEEYTAKRLTVAAKRLMADKMAHDKERGIARTTLRTMIIGIPNAGKSTLMNRLAGKKVAVTGNRPGVTKGQQWIRTNKELELLDTPGILWPKFEDQLVGLKLALTGAIKDDLLPMDEVTIFGLTHFLKNYRSVTMKRYRMSEEDLELEIPELIMELTARFGFRDDYDRFYTMFVKDVRDGKLGLFCLDEVVAD